jgi:hypothetical protein
MRADPLSLASSAVLVCARTYAEEAPSVVKEKVSRFEIARHFENALKELPLAVSVKELKGKIAPPSIAVTSE